MTLRTKLILLVLAMVLPIMAGITCVLFDRARNLVNRQIDQHLNDQLRFVETQLRNRQDNIIRISNVIAQRTSVKKILHVGSGLGMNQTLNRIIKVYPNLNYLIVVDNGGEIYAANTLNADGEKVDGEALLGLNVNQIDRYSALLNNVPSVGIPDGDPFLSKMGNEPTLSQLFSAPVASGNRLLGWILVSDNWQNRVNLLLQKTKQRLMEQNDPITQVLLLDTDQNIIAGGVYGQLWKSGTADRIKSKPFFIRDKEFRLVISSDNQQLNQPLVNARSAILVGVAITTVGLLLGLYVILTYLIVNRIKNLNQATRAIASGDYRHRIKSPGADEFGLLAKNFNRMASALFESETRLKQKVVDQTADLLKQKNALLASNKDLDKFAYVASHDLKAPLRGINQLSRWIDEDLDDEDEVRKHVRLMQSRVNRMEKLLDDLLEYSRIGRSKMKWKTIDTRDVLASAFEMATPPAAFRIELDPRLPVFETVAVPFEQIMRNLISNAIKHHDRDAGKITVSVVDNSDNYVFEVTDDGPGIAPKYHAKIFEMFQTLKPRDQVEGSGVGLAMINKIVNTYGGSIAVISEEQNRGTCFRLIWAKKIERFKKNESGVFVPKKQAERPSI